MIENFEFKTKYGVSDLVEIIRLLRTPEGCPWDREQTHESIKKNFIEETYEVVEAINKDNPVMLREELGDVLMQILLHAQMESEAGNFTFDDVVDELAQKLIMRHPHVFGKEHCETAEEVLNTWDRVKTETKQLKSATQAMQTIPKELPALMRAEKIQKKAAKVGFDWEDASGALEKVHSECDELAAEIRRGNESAAFEELGDLLFSCVNVSRFIKADSEQALTFANEKYIKRFSIVEQLAAARSIDMKTASLEELDILWEEAKKLTK